jgi:hypothetical protein
MQGLAGIERGTSPPGPLSHTFGGLRLDIAGEGVTVDDGVRKKASPVRENHGML